MGTPSNNEGVFSFEELASGNSPFNAITYLVAQILAGVNIATLVRVEAVHGGGTDPVGTVDVTPLVNQTDGAGQAVPHTTVFGLPYFRLQGGSNAVIVDPVKGDIGVAVFADRDLSNIKAKQVPANPNSRRRFSFADGVYFGGWMPQVAPVRFIRVSDSGIVISSAAGIEQDGPVAIKGDVAVTGKVGVTQHYEVSGVQVVGVQQGSIPPPTGGGTVDAQARVTIGQILTALETHGLIAP